jgi:hypothetical protein
MTKYQVFKSSVGINYQIFIAETDADALIRASAFVGDLHAPGRCWVNKLDGSRVRWWLRNGAWQISNALADYREILREDERALERKTKIVESAHNVYGTLCTLGLSEPLAMPADPEHNFYKVAWRIEKPGDKQLYWESKVDAAVELELGKYTSIGSKYVASAPNELHWRVYGAGLRLPRHEARSGYVLVGPTSVTLPKVVVATLRYIAGLATKPETDNRVLTREWVAGAFETWVEKEGVVP